MKLLFNKFLIGLFIFLTLSSNAQKIETYIYNGKNYYIYPYRISEPKNVYSEEWRDVPNYAGKLVDGEYIVFFKLPKYYDEKNKFISENPAATITLKNNSKNGLAKFFDFRYLKRKGKLTKNIIQQGFYNNDNREKIWIECNFTETGELFDSTVQAYNNNIKNGFYGHWRKGKLVETGFFENNEKNGTWINFDQHSQNNYKIGIFAGWQVDTNFYRGYCIRRFFSPKGRFEFEEQYYLHNNQLFLKTQILDSMASKQLLQKIEFVFYEDNRLLRHHNIGDFIKDVFELKTDSNSIQKTTIYFGNDSQILFGNNYKIALTNLNFYWLRIQNSGKKIETDTIFIKCNKIENKLFPFPIYELNVSKAAENISVSCFIKNSVIKTLQVNVIRNFQKLKNNSKKRNTSKKANYKLWVKFQSRSVHYFQLLKIKSRFWPVIETDDIDGKKQIVYYNSNMHLLDFDTNNLINNYQKIDIEKSIWLKNNKQYIFILQDSSNLVIADTNFNYHSEIVSEEEYVNCISREMIDDLISPKEKIDEILLEGASNIFNNFKLAQNSKRLILNNKPFSGKIIYQELPTPKAKIKPLTLEMSYSYNDSLQIVDSIFVLTKWKDKREISFNHDDYCKLGNRCYHSCFIGKINAFQFVNGILHGSNIKAILSSNVFNKKIIAHKYYDVVPYIIRNFYYGKYQGMQNLNYSFIEAIFTHTDKNYDRYAYKNDFSYFFYNGAPLGCQHLPTEIQQENDLDCNIYNSFFWFNRSAEFFGDYYNSAQQVTTRELLPIVNDTFSGTLINTSNLFLSDSINFIKGYLNGNTKSFYTKSIDMINSEILGEVKQFKSRQYEKFSKTNNIIKLLPKTYQTTTFKNGQLINTGNFYNLDGSINVTVEFDTSFAWKPYVFYVDSSKNIFLFDTFGKLEDINNNCIEFVRKNPNLKIINDEAEHAEWGNWGQPKQDKENTEIHSGIVFQYNKIYCSGEFIQYTEPVINSNENYYTPFIEHHSNWPGYHTYYYKAAGKSAEGRVKNKSKIGWWKYYFENGYINKEINYYNDKIKHPFNAKDSVEIKGFVKGFAPNGKIIYEGYITDQEFTNACNTSVDISINHILFTKVFDSVGNNVLIYNQRIKVVDYQFTGNKQNEGFTVNGNRDSIWRMYSKSGQLTEIGKYRNNLKEGRWISGDIDGLGIVDDLCFAVNDTNRIKELQQHLKFTTAIYQSGEIIKIITENIELSGQEQNSQYYSDEAIKKIMKDTTEYFYKKR